MRHSGVVRQCVLMVTSALIVVVVLVKADVPGRMAYSVERGRLRALRESLPSTKEVATRFEADRAVVATVLPAVVSISTERTFAMSDLKGLPPRFHRFLFPRDGAEPAGTNGAPSADTNGAPSADTNGAPSADTNGASTAAPDEDSVTLPSGQGSGFIIDARKGFIVTNNHVVSDSSAITVRLGDGRRFEAELLGSDPKTDLAVLRIEASRLHEVSWDDGFTSEVGDEVFAVGSPFGLAGTVSRGIISAKNRSNVRLPDVEYEGFLQTDAVINPGNSGGPLVNMRGQVVGINTAIATRSGNYDGIGFAIPAYRAVKLIPQLIRGLPITRGYLGVEMAGRRPGEELKRDLGWEEPGGVVITEIVEGGPASRSDLRTNDILVEYEGKPIATNADVIEAVADTPPGQVVRVKVWRERAFALVRVEIGRQPEGFSTRGWRPEPETE